MKERFAGYPYRLLISWLPLLAALCCLSLYTELPLGTFALSMLLLLFLAAAAALDRRFGIAGTLLLSFAVYVLVLLPPWRTSVIDSLVLLFSGELAEKSTAGNFALFLCAIPIAIAALYTMRLFPVRIVLSLLWTGYWITAAILELDFSKAAATAMLPVLLYTLAELLRRRQGISFFDRSSVASGLIALFTAGAILLSLLPVSDRPYSYPILNAIWSKVEELAENIETHFRYRGSGSDEYSLGMNGFAEGSGHTASGTLTLTAKARTNGRVYLGANSWNSFDGTDWSNTVPEEYGDILTWNADTAEQLYALYRCRNAATEDSEVEPFSATDYFRENNILVSYDKLKTRTLFAPLGTLLIKADEDRYPWTAGAGTIRFDYSQDRDAIYRVYYLEQNSQSVPALIQASEGYAYDASDKTEWYNVYHAFRTDFILFISSDTRIEQLLSARTEAIEAVYLGTSDAVSEKAKQLAQAITASCETDYERVSAIARYLHNNYRYTTSPEPCPDGENFLDWVLFETDSGYCTWYATASVLLLRSLGIPARFVQGYAVTLKEGTAYSITSEDAHAWCEAYIEGWGWITVEATPGFTMTTGGWTVTGSAGSADEEYYEEEEDYGYGTASDIRLPETDSAEAAEQEAENSSISIPPALLVIPAAAALLAVMMFFDTRRRRYLAASWSEKTKLDLQRALRNLERRGLERRKNETLSEYFHRLNRTLEVSSSELKQTVTLYEELFFNDRELTEEEWKASQKFLAVFRKQRK